jgi:hypothetical protein
MNLRLFSLLIGVILFLGSFISIVYASHSWENYHWARTSNPFTLKVVDSTTVAWDSYRVAALADWSASTVLDLATEAGSDSLGTRWKCRAVLGKVRACNYTYGDNGWLGLARVWVYSTGHIAQGTAQMNDTYFNTPTYNTPAWRRLVMCQELAHDVGLDHQDETFNNANLGSCMDYTSDPDGPLSNEHPNTHDFAQLETIYAHLDSTTTIGQSVFGSGNRALGNGVDGEEVAEWGKAIRTSSDGKPSLFERDLGNGNKVFTFVIWAQD